MTMPSSGPLNMGGTSSPVSVAHELGLGLTTTISMNQANVRTLAGVSGTSGSTWSMNSLYGKSNVTISLASVTSNEPFAATPPAGGEPSTAVLSFLSNGTWSATLEASASKSGNWATPTTTSIGAGYWIRFTRTFFFQGGAGNSASGSTGWLQLNVTQDIFVERTSAPGTTTADYTIEIATDSGGTNIIATASLITLSAQTT